MKLQTLSWATANPSRLKNVFFCISFSWARRPVSCSEKQALLWGAERWLNNVIIARVNLHCLSCLTHYIAVHKSMWTVAWNSHWPRQQSIVLLDVRWRRDAFSPSVRMFGEEQTCLIQQHHFSQNIICTDFQMSTLYRPAFPAIALKVTRSQHQRRLPAQTCGRGQKRPSHYF